MGKKRQPLQVLQLNNKEINQIKEKEAFYLKANMID
jgi:hypothetical protein